MQAELMFTELKYLAEERSPEKRLDLLHKITDLFFAAIDMHSEAETSLFNEVIERFVDQISRDAKIDVATNLATLPGFPLPVVRKLALAVAALLSHHTKLGRNVLMKILSGGTAQTVLVLLGALDLRWTTVAAFMAFRVAKQRTRPSPDVNTRRDYEAIDATAARRTLAFFKSAPRLAPR
jgi:hypothetical protein